MNNLSYLVSIYKEYLGDRAETILDIGSRDGDDAYYLATSLNSKNIYTFEPNSKCHLLIKNRYPQFNNIYCAVSDYKGFSIFNRVESNDWDAVGTSSLRNRTDSWYDGKIEKVEVPVNRMDNLIKKYSIVIPMDLVKIDTEGCSYEVLFGFGENINDVKMFHIENETYQYWENQKLASDVADLLTSKNFKKIHSHKFGVNSVDEVWINGNII